MTFKDTPFADRLFARTCQIHGCLDGGLGWRMRQCPGAGQAGPVVDWASVGAEGLGNEEIQGLPQDLPPFRYGHADDVPFLSMTIASATYVRRGDVRTLHVAVRLPETALVAAAGRPLRDIIRIEGLEEDVVIHAVDASTGGRSEVSLVLE